MHWAAKHSSSPEVVKLLLEAGGAAEQLHAKDSNGSLPMHFAMEKNICLALPVDNGRYELHHSTQMPDGWGKYRDKYGNRYYSEHSSGASSWTAPEGATGGSTGHEIYI